jgi:uncharacterized membrane protein
LTHDGTSKQRSIGGNRAGTPPLTHRAAVAAVARFAAVLLLVGVVAVGVHRPQVWTGTSGGDLWRGEQANLGGGAAVWPLIVAGALLLVMLLLLGRSRRRRRRPEDELVHSESPIPWTAKALAMTVVLAVIATLVVVLWYLLRSSQWPNSTGDAGAAELGIPPAQSPAVDEPAPPAGRLVAHCRGRCGRGGAAADRWAGHGGRSPLPASDGASCRNASRHECSRSGNGRAARTRGRPRRGHRLLCRDGT